MKWGGTVRETGNLAGARGCQGKGGVVVGCGRCDERVGGFSGVQPVGPGQ